jgi:hypothetical protein
MRQNLALVGDRMCRDRIPHRTATTIAGIDLLRRAAAATGRSGLHAAAHAVAQRSARTAQLLITDR